MTLILTTSEKISAFGLNTGQNIAEKFEKSHLDQVLNSEALTIKKTGEEIIDKLEDLLKEEEEYVKEYKEDLEESMSEAGIVPDEEVSEWEKKELEDVPKRYSWKQRCSNQCIESGNGSAPENPTPQPTDEQKKAMSEYNETVGKLIGCMLEVKRIKTLVENLDKTKSFELNTELASMLGF